MRSIGFFAGDFAYAHDLQYVLEQWKFSITYADYQLSIFGFVTP